MGRSMNDAVDLVAIAAAAEHKELSAGQLSAGARLAQARVAQGFSLEQIEAHLKWSPRQIAEIEAGNYSVFPDMASVRGFVRSYAKYLKVDPAPLLAELAGELPRHPVKAIDRPQLDMPFSTGRLPWLGKEHHNSQKIAALLSLVFLCLVALFVYRTEVLGLASAVLPAKAAKTGVSQEPAPIGKEVAPAEVKPAAVATTPQATVAAATTVMQKLEASKSDEATGPAAVAPVASAPERVVPLEKVPVAEAKKAEVVPVAPIAPGSALVLTFRQDSWLQLRRSNGSVMIARLFKAGSEQTIDVSEPMTMVLGNAPGVDVRLRGVAVALPAQPGTNVVNVNIK